ncbi:hypothetical protein [uncultured Desulfuromonas sp.]|uniref:hypothetical protein n=1 Tax=uncultured Desulfuromonas sp. TaxID=181013 RepID=UPI002AAB2015|nr:hypothetical protein [uncultured Desulfuromonas sp.]
MTGINAHFDIRWRRIAETRGLHSLTVDDLGAACSANQRVFTRIADHGGVLYFQGLKLGREQSPPLTKGRLGMTGTVCPSLFASLEMIRLVLCQC